MTITIKDVDSYDWDGDSRPDRNYNNAVLRTKTDKTEREEINTMASANMYTMIMTFDNNTFLGFRVDQRIALGSIDIRNTVLDLVQTGASVASGSSTPAVALAGVISNSVISLFQYKEKGSFVVTGDTKLYGVNKDVQGDTLSITVSDA